jgi:hypothetical protein
MLIEVDIILAGHITWTTGRSIAKTDGHATEPDGQVGLTNTHPPALPERASRRWETLRARWACALVRLQRQTTPNRRHGHWASTDVLAVLAHSLFFVSSHGIFLLFLL